MLNGGHYISYACNPNGNWYCYNDSSCREVLTDAPDSGLGSGLGSRSSPYSGCTPLSRRKNIQRKHSTASSGNGTIETCSSPSFGRKETSTPNATRKNSLQSVKTPVLQRRDSNHKRESSSGIESNATSTENVSNVGDSEEKLMRESPYSSTRSLFKCPYAETRIPKIDTSTAYILFYERSGLDSRPYLPKIDPNAAQNVQVPDLEEDEALRKQQCSIQ